MIEISVASLASGGDGVARTPQGLTVFVPHSAPGDRLGVTLTEEHKTYARARIDRIVEAGPGRVAPPCPVAGRCGGCAWQHLDYSVQAEAKLGFLIENLKRIGKLAEPPVRELWTAASPLGYRNKAQVPVATAPDGSLRVGYYKEGSHDVIALPEEGCRLLDPAADTVLRFAREHLASLGLQPYDQRKGSGTLRHLMLRSTTQGQVMLVFVTREPMNSAAKKAAASWIGAVAGLVAVHNNIQAKTGNVILGNETHAIAGPDQLEENLEGLRFKLAATSFFQVNPAQTLKLWKALAEARAWNKGEKVLELYCGVGTLSLPLARMGVDLIGIETHEAAVEDARANALLNGFSNLRFDVADAVTAWNALPEGWTPDLMLVDPPRKGLDAQVIDALAKHPVPELLYVSCDPASLARDTARLADQGYQMQSCQPVDLFPQTAHVESVSLFKAFSA